MGKKVLIAILLMLLIPAFISSETSMNELTKGYADTLYCGINTGCTGIGTVYYNITVDEDNYTVFFAPYPI